MQYKLIDTAGQVTAVITGVLESPLSELATIIMDKNPTIEQVGYLRDNQFIMMGGELSINGTLAAAYVLGGSGTINGYKYVVGNKLSTVMFPSNIVLSVCKKVVKLEGITYQVCDRVPTSRKIYLSTKQLLRSLSTNSPASGIIYSDSSQITPLIYVKATNTFVWENACGSGSLAYALVTGKSKITQPSGQTIKFEFTKKNITVMATVKEI